MRRAAANPAAKKATAAISCPAPVKDVGTIIRTDDITKPMIILDNMQ